MKERQPNTNDQRTDSGKPFRRLGLAYSQSIIKQTHRALEGITNMAHTMLRVVLLAALCAHIGAQDVTKVRRMLVHFLLQNASTS